MAADEIMQDSDLAPESRSDAFSGGIAGGGHIASSLPEVQQASPDFDASGSVLTAANLYSGVLNGSSENTLRISSPYDLAMRQTLQSSGKGTIQ